MMPGLTRLLWALALVSAPAWAADPAAQQAYADAWWTGPLLAASPSALPTGHVLVEPYLYDVIAFGSYDGHGHEHAAGHTDNIRSLSYLLYGLTDPLTVGLLPRFGYNAGGAGTHSSSAQPGDLTLHASYQLLKFREHRWPPALALVLEETLPTGRYDRLGSFPGDGLGAGVYATTLGLYTQRYFWASNGRIVRTRLDFSYSHSNPASLRDVSVYGTQAGFVGHAAPGDSIVIDSAWEYSLTQNWVLALDISYERDASTHVTGRNTAGSAPPTPVSTASGTSTAWALAPAVEYNWSGTVGVIVGAKTSVAGRNSGAFVIPVVAVNWVR
jgi:hypothetical protein